MKGVHHSSMGYNVFKAVIHVRYPSPIGIPPKYPPDIPVDKKKRLQTAQTEGCDDFFCSNFTRNQTMGRTNDFMWKNYFSGKYRIPIIPPSNTTFCV